MSIIGMELGHADDLLFKRTNSKQGAGSVGLFTHGAIDRTSYYSHAVVLAFAPFLWPDLYTLTPASADATEGEETR